MYCLRSFCAVPAVCTPRVGSTAAWPVALRSRPCTPATANGPRAVGAGSVWSGRLSPSPLPRGEGSPWRFRDGAEGSFGRLVLRGPFLASWRRRRARGLRCWDFSRVPDEARSTAPRGWVPPPSATRVSFSLGKRSFKRTLVKCQLFFRKCDVANAGGETGPWRPARGSPGSRG